MRSLIAIGIVVVLMQTVCRGDHPQILVKQSDRETLLRKIQDVAWTKTAYAAMRAELDPIIARSEADPSYASSRLFMNWETHFETPLVLDSTCVGGEGKASVPTPRFAGARNWATDYERPDKLDDWMPYNDQNGKAYLRNRTTGKMEWVEPAVTGRTFESGNEQIMNLAANAAFIYWLDRDEKYAKFAAGILTTYMGGFAVMKPPRAVKPDDKMMEIIGPTSFEVIHENLVIPTALAYDFLEPYLKAHGTDTFAIQLGFQRWARRVTDGGFSSGNWNLNQAVMISYAAMALEDNEHYENKQGRAYFVDVVLNADLPTQHGLTRVIKEGFDPVSGLWPEAAGYGIGAAGQLVELAFMLSNDPAGAKILGEPTLAKAIDAERQIIYSNGLAIGVGDTTSVRLNTKAVEMMIAFARQVGSASLENRMTAILQNEITSGRYARGKRPDLLALTKYVDELHPVAGELAKPDRTFWYPGMSIAMQQNVANDSKTALAAALYGTNGGHTHANGLSIELYGAGYIQGADPGRGASYWTADHRDYYLTPVAHNTVIINGQSTYNEKTSPDKEMNLIGMEPASGEPGISGRISFVRSGFKYATPLGTQERLLALVRTSDQGGFYYDVFRSKAGSGANEFHDYLYHNMGQSVIAYDALSTAIPLSSSSQLHSKGTQLLKGYDYFKNERSARLSTDFRVEFKLKTKADEVGMNLWMLNAGERELFTVDAPKNNAIREEIDATVRNSPMPTLIVRQTGPAWDRPFVSVFEPFDVKVDNRIKAVRDVSGTNANSGLTATRVDTTVGASDQSVLLLQDASPRDRVVDDVNFNGSFAAVFGSAGMEHELYLGSGIALTSGDVSIRAADPKTTSADVQREGESWIVSSQSPLRVSLPFDNGSNQKLLGNGKVLGDVKWSQSRSNSKNYVATISLPAGHIVLSIGD